MGGGARYWIDGYNVLLRLRIGEGQSLQERRDELVARVGALGKEAWIVFDSREAVHGLGASLPRRVQVLFARGGRSADELLIEKVQHAPDLSGVIVVSDDREIATRVSFLGARTMGTAEFGRLLKPTSGPTSRKERGLSSSEVDEWMKYFGWERIPEEPAPGAPSRNPPESPISPAPLKKPVRKKHPRK